MWVAHVRRDTVPRRYNLVLTHVALECEHSDDPNVDVAYNAKGNVSLLWKDSEREFLALVLNPTSGPHKKLRLVFNNEVELVARGGNLTAFLFFHLVNVSKLVRTYVGMLLIVYCRCPIC